MRIGPHFLSSNLCLSPLAGYTNLPMRLTVRSLTLKFAANSVLVSQERRLLLKIITIFE